MLHRDFVVAGRRNGDASAEKERKKRRVALGSPKKSHLVPHFDRQKILVSYQFGFGKRPLTKARPYAKGMARAPRRIAQKNRFLVGSRHLARKDRQ
ncbi:hypothetical protein [Methylosinus sporium]|uniref:hypothetical protein n=1 Tax=Methylosinus sporium TaxID=428 RepID=UPI00383AA7CD